MATKYVMATISLPMEIAPDGTHRALNEHLDIVFAPCARPEPGATRSITELSVKLRQVIQNMLPVSEPLPEKAGSATGGNVITLYEPCAPRSVPTNVTFKAHKQGAARFSRKRLSERGDDKDVP